jgi:hypothetical protein
MIRFSRIVNRLVNFTTPLYYYLSTIQLYKATSKLEMVCMLNVERKNVERKNVGRKKCRINIKLCLMLIIKYLFDFNGKKKKNTFITSDK